MTCCPTCGHPLSTRTADQMIAILRAHPDRAVYLAQNGGYFINYRGGPVDHGAIVEALERGLIMEKFPGKGHQYWVLALR